MFRRKGTYASFFRIKAQKATGTFKMKAMHSSRTLVNF
jgi:hypothetical protein